MLKALYFNMALGAIGTLLIALVAMSYVVEQHYNLEYGFILFGFILTIGYINYLEKKAGISKEMTWIRIIISIILLGLFYLFFIFIVT